MVQREKGAHRRESGINDEEMVQKGRSGIKRRRREVMLAKSRVAIAIGYD